MAKMVLETGDRKTRFRVIGIAGDGEVAWAQWVAGTPRAGIDGCGLHRVRDGKLTCCRDCMNPVGH